MGLGLTRWTSKLESFRFKVRLSSGGGNDCELVDDRNSKSGVAREKYGRMLPLVTGRGMGGSVGEGVEGVETVEVRAEAARGWESFWLSGGSWI